jgi:uncharacterized integral membrane protein
LSIIWLLLAVLAVRVTATRSVVLVAVRADFVAPLRLLVAAVL